MTTGLKVRFLQVGRCNDWAGKVTFYWCKVSSGFLRKKCEFSSVDFSGQKRWKQVIAMDLTAWHSGDTEGKSIPWRTVDRLSKMGYITVTAKKFTETLLVYILRSNLGGWLKRCSSPWRIRKGNWQRKSNVTWKISAADASEIFRLFTENRLYEIREVLDAVSEYPKGDFFRKT